MGEARTPNNELALMGYQAGIMDKATGRTANMDYPDYAAEIDAIKESEITPELLQRHYSKAPALWEHMKDLYGRYQNNTLLYY